MDWVFYEGLPGVQADLSCARGYVISHRTNQYNVSFRPPGGHHHVGCGTTLEEAKTMAEEHAAGTRAALPIFQNGALCTSR